jgi:hypothetical protein
MSDRLAGVVQKRSKKKTEQIYAVLHSKILWWFAPGDAGAVAVPGTGVYERKARGYFLLHGGVTVFKTPARTAADLTTHAISIEEDAKVGVNKQGRTVELLFDSAAKLATWLSALSASASGAPNATAIDQASLAANQSLSSGQGFGKLFKAAKARAATAMGGEESSDASGSTSSSSAAPAAAPGPRGPSGPPASGGGGGIYGSAPNLDAAPPGGQYGAAPVLGGGGGGGGSNYGAAPSLAAANIGGQYGAAPGMGGGGGRNQYAKVHVDGDGGGGGGAPSGGVYGGIGGVGAPAGGMYGKAPGAGAGGGGYGSVPQPAGMNLPPLPGYQNVPGGATAPPKQFLDGSTNLAVFEWFHGTVSRSDTEVLLWGQPDGVFLVRNSSEPGDWVISWMDMDTLRHIKIEVEQGGAKRYRSGTSMYDSIAEAITDLRANAALTNPLPSSDATVCDFELKKYREVNGTKLRNDIPAR